MSNSISYSGFVSPKSILWGKGSISGLAKVRGPRVAIISDRARAEAGWLERSRKIIENTGSATMVFAETDNLNFPAGVDTIVKQLDEFVPSSLVAIGNSTAMSIARLLRLRLKNSGGLNGNTLRRARCRGWRGQIEEFVAVPSAEGVTGAASRDVEVIAEGAQKTQLLNSEENVPDIAILDPELANPDELGNGTGWPIAWLSGAVESYVNVGSSPFSRSASFSAVCIIIRNLSRALLHSDPAARERMLYAAFLAGLGTANAGEGVCRSISDAVAKQHGLPTELACAIALPYCINFNRSAAQDAYVDIARVAGFRGEEPEDAVAYLVRRVRDFRGQLGIPDSYAETGIAEDQYLGKTDSVVSGAMDSPAMTSNPRQCGRRELAALLVRCYRGVLKTPFAARHDIPYEV